MKSMSAAGAKDGFGHLIETARQEPVKIEKHGRPFQSDNEMRNIVLTDAEDRDKATRYFFGRALREVRESHDAGAAGV